MFSALVPLTVTMSLAAGPGAVFASADPPIRPSAAFDTVKKVLPLAPTRSAKFTTTKGTWMSVDVSPDGQKIVFDLLGDLYTLPIAGGKATRITSGIAYDAQPRFSPDGRRIVFLSDRTGGENVWLGQRATAADSRPLTERATTTRTCRRSGCPTASTS